MAREDIEIHINTGDVAIAPQNSYTVRDFRWVNTAADELSRYVYGEVDIPAVISEKQIRAKGVDCVIPYTPKYKEFKVRFRRVNEDGTYTYLHNDSDASTNWHIVKVKMYGGDESNVFVSELPAISETAFHIEFGGGAVMIYSASQSDFNIVNANRQNANCMLACVPGQNYRYPLTGVGMIRWVNSTNVLSSKLTDTICEEFSSDGVTVKKAVFNYDTRQMEMQLEAQND